jgi:hypothetical protein
MVEVLRSDITLDLPNTDKSGVLRNELPFRGRGLMLLLSVFSNFSAVPTIFTGFKSGLSFPATFNRSFDLRRRAQMKIRISSALPPIASTMAVATLNSTCRLKEFRELLGDDVHAFNPLEVPHSPALLLPYMKSDCSRESPAYSIFQMTQVSSDSCQM